MGAARVLSDNIRPSVGYRLGLGALILAVFGVVLWVPFQYDDALYILANPKVTGPWPGLGAIFGEISYRGTGEYEPLVVLAHRWLYAAFGENHLPYSISSLLLHWLNAALLFGLLGKLLQDEETAFWAALLFAVYPAHSEVLAVSSFRKHLFAGLGSLGVLSVLLAHGLRPWQRRLGCWALMPLALLGKESAAMLPLLAALVAVVWAKGRARIDKPLLAGLFLECLAFACLRSWALPRRLGALQGGDWSSHLLSSAKSLLWYAGQLPLPRALCLEHDLLPVESALSFEGFAVTIGAALLLAGARWAWRKDRIVGLGLAWSLCALSPFLNLIPFLNFSLVADRYLYLASAGWALAAARLGALFLPSRSRRLALACAAAAYAALALRGSARFAHPLELWRHTVECAPLNPRAHGALGVEYRLRRHHGEAVSELEKAVALHPGYAEPWFDLGLAYYMAGRLDDAIAATRRYHEMMLDVRALVNLGAFYLEAGRLAEAEDALEQAVSLEPERAEARLNLGRARLRLGALDEAARELSFAARDEKQRAKALAALGELEQRRGRREAAAAHYEESLSLEPEQLETTRRLARHYCAEGDARRALETIERLLARLESRLSELRARAGVAERENLRYLEGLRDEARAERRRLLSPAARARRSPRPGAP